MNENENSNELPAEPEPELDAGDQLPADDAGEHEPEPDAGDELPDDELPDDELPDDEPRIAAVRAEAARYRTRARDAETVAEGLRDELRAALIELDGRAVPAIELPADVELTPAGVAEAVTEALEHSPHLRRRRAAGNIGQGEASDDAGEVSLVSLLRA